MAGLWEWLKGRSARFWVGLVSGLLLVVLAIEVALSLHGDNIARPQGNGPDATVFISTLILIYTVFVTVLGALLAQAADKRSRGFLERLILVLMFLAVAVNLWRIQNSVGDLYETTLGNLPADKVDDAAYEFIHYYFYSNVVVIGIALLVLSMRPRGEQ
jgi:hypothetical protein